MIGNWEIYPGLLQLHENVARLEDQIALLRSSRLGGLKKELEEKDALVKELRQRRGAGQRTLAEANLDKRRAKLAQEKAKKFEEAFQQLAAGEAARHANEPSLQEAQAHVGALQEQLDRERALRIKYEAIIKPPKEYFFVNGHFSTEVDLTALELIADCGVSRNVVPKLFLIFARFYKITLPHREKKVLVKTEGGQRCYEPRQVYWIPGVSHCKQLPAIGGELHNIQTAEWLMEDIDGSYCYVADGANSQQRELLGQILSRRDKNTGKLDSRILSISAIADKTAVGQRNTYNAALKAITDAGEAAGLFHDLALAEALEANSVPLDDDCTFADDGLSFFERRRKKQSQITSLVPSSSQNDRAANGRCAASLILTGRTGSIMPTCAEHATVNIGEKAREALDVVVRRELNISDEDAEKDKAKLKAMRTCVGWFSSPACALTYEVSKYVALFSSKGYAIGENFAQWLAHKEKAHPERAGNLYGNVEDLLAICGGRSYIFFLDAAVVDRFAQDSSLLGYLREEADLATAAGGKLRSAILAGFSSPHIMAAVRALAIISDAWVWPTLTAVKPGDDKHILDVLPIVWPESLRWLREAATDPSAVIEGTMRLDTFLEAKGQRVLPRSAPSMKTRGDWRGCEGGIPHFGAGSGIHLASGDSNGLVAPPVAGRSWALRARLEA